MSDYGALSSKQAEITKELNRYLNIAKGNVPGFQSKLIKKEDYQTLPKLKDFVGKASGSKDIIQDTAAVVTRSQVRDLNYAMAGRTYLMTAGLNRKILTLKNRAAIIKQIEG